jgi:hypothetical protein
VWNGDVDLENRGISISKKTEKFRTILGSFDTLSFDFSTILGYGREHVLQRIEIQTWMSPRKYKILTVLPGAPRAMAQFAESAILAWVGGVVRSDTVGLEEEDGIVVVDSKASNICIDCV